MLSTGVGVAGWHNNPDFTYQWTRDGQPIPGENSNSTQLTEYRDAQGNVTNPNGDDDHQIGCTVIGSNDIGASNPNTSLPVHAVDRAPRLVFTTPQIGRIPDDPNAPYDPLKQTLTCSPSQWYDDYGQYQFQWVRHSLSGDVPIAGATTSRYRPTTNDIGRSLLCQVTNTNPAGSTVAISGSGFNINIADGLHDVDVPPGGAR